jgi:signal transduction histidine kinase
MPEKSDRLAAEVKMLRKRLAQCERAVERHKLAEKTARSETEKLRALLLEFRKQRSSARAGPLSPGPRLTGGRTGNNVAGDRSTATPAWGGQDAWVNTIAHELKQPLTAIVNYTRACSRLVEGGQADAGELLDALQQAANQAERAADMIQQLRRVAVPGRLQTSTVDLGSLCREAAALLERDLQAAGAALELQIPPTLATVPADLFQVRLVLVNLVRNAIESLARGKQKLIRITVSQSEAEIEVAVHDTGEGLSVAMVRNLFEPYQSTKPEGMGLGLALCRAVVQAHGGRIWAKSHRPQGTTFTFTLPIQSPL